MEHQVYGLLKKMMEPTEREEKVARFLEDLFRKDDEEKELYPSLKRVPRDKETWIGWMGSAKDLLKLLDE